MRARRVLVLAAAIAIVATAATAWATDCAMRGETLELELVESTGTAPPTSTTAKLRPYYGGTISLERDGAWATLRAEK